MQHTWPWQLVISPLSHQPCRSSVWRALSRGKGDPGLFDTTCHSFSTFQLVPPCTSVSPPVKWDSSCNPDWVPRLLWESRGAV